MCLFLALAAQEQMVINFGYTTNTFQQSLPPTKQCYIQIDEAHQSWHKKQHGTCLDPKLYVIPLLQNLQGHPEAGKCFEVLVNKILQTNMKFTTTTHEQNLYQGMIQGHKILIC